jgi:hypothetical protein
MRSLPYPSQLKYLSKKEISLITGPHCSEKADVIADLLGVDPEALQSLSVLFCPSSCMSQPPPRALYKAMRFVDTVRLL